MAGRARTTSGRRLTIAGRTTLRVLAVTARGLPIRFFFLFLFDFSSHFFQLFRAWRVWDCLPLLGLSMRHTNTTLHTLHITHTHTHNYCGHVDPENACCYCKGVVNSVHSNTHTTHHTHTQTTHAHTCITMCACMQTAKIKKVNAHAHASVISKKNHSVSIRRLKQNIAKTLRAGRTRLAEHVTITSLKQASFAKHLQQTFFTTHTHNLVTCDDHKLQAEVGTNGQKKDNCGWENSADNCCFCGEKKNALFTPVLFCCFFSLESPVLLTSQKLSWTRALGGGTTCKPCSPTQFFNACNDCR